MIQNLIPREIMIKGSDALYDLGKNNILYKRGFDDDELMGDFYCLGIDMNDAIIL